MAYNKGTHSSNSGGNRGRRYAFMLLLAFWAALFGAFALHKLRETRIRNLLVKDKNSELLSLHLLLQKEKDNSKELKRKNEELKAKIYTFTSQKRELQKRVMGMQSIIDSLKDEQKMIGTAFEERQNEIKMLQEKVKSLGKVHLDFLRLTKNLKQKEAEIEDLKQRLGFPVKNHWVRQNEKSSVNYGNGKNITNEGKPFWSKEAMQVEDTSEPGTAEKRASREQGKKIEGSQVDGSVSLAAKETDVQFMDDKENKPIRKEQPQLLENDTSGVSQEFHVKQSAEGSRISEDLKGKDVPLGRIKGKGWKMIANSRLRESNGISESHRAANKRNRKTYTDEQDDLKDRIVGTVSHNENLNREEEGMDDNNPGKNKMEAIY